MQPPLRKSAPWPPNMSDGDASCAAPAAPHGFLKPWPSFLRVLQNLHVWFDFGKVQDPLGLPGKMTFERPKVVRMCGVFTYFHFKMCFAPQPRAIF